MIYKKIKFSVAPFSYELEFTSRITLVRGDSATGKTYLYQILEDVKFLPQYQNMKLFNYKSDNFHEELAKCRSKFIIIDNADILLTDEDKRFINFEKTNQYMLFMRNCDGLNLTSDSFTVLDDREYRITLRREIATV